MGINSKPFSVEWISSDSINLLTGECFMETFWVSGNLDQNASFLNKMLYASWLPCTTGKLLVVWDPCSKDLTTRDHDLIFVLNTLKASAQ